MSHLRALVLQMLAACGAKRARLGSPPKRVEENQTPLAPMKQITVSTELQELVEGLRTTPNKCIGVLGDLMLDEYILGNASRISPEAPVPVVQVDRIIFQPGGAANVAENVRALGAHPILFGVVGQDEFGQVLLNRLRADGADTAAVLTDPSRPTTRKTRIVAHNQQVVRTDHESSEPLATPVQKQLLRRLEDSLGKLDALIISDYDKGLLTPPFVSRLMWLLRRQNLRCYVDPKGRSVKRFRGAFLVKPGKPEAERIAGFRITDEEGLVRAAHKIFAMYNCSYVIITEGPRGMTVFSAKGQRHRVPATAREVYDITGAGDTVIATLAVAMTASASALKAARLADVTASIVISKVGTAVCTLAELQNYLGKSPTRK